MTGRVNKWLAVSIVLLLVAAVGTAFYFLLLAPRYQEIDRLAAMVQSEKKVLAAMEQNVSPKEGEALESLAALQKKVPTRPLIDQLLLEFQKAEYVSDSLLVNIRFSEKEQVSRDETGAPPTGIETVSAQLTVQSPSYYQLERFLETLERAERIMAIESLTFTGPPELTSTSTDIHPLTYSLTVRAFYAPKLEKWKQLLPARDVPPPGDKDNPLTEIAPSVSP
ncbi:pilus assembly protein PilO [Geobacillus thermodenitrificans]|uniref:pilus assembly protein PilO n=1 Tax=Geobacillus thermodenitrificans TaxID=33940 RepID=UPI0004040AD2|nr:pilus assembly protein PilO [Geobacillus thermodenitrificans]ARA98931.1 pilus assembly protein PilO [Geobacillus thermodenitrificans]PJW22215.1 pilus assembly protein PilO [Geobacillus thermodenitrificans]